MAQMSIRSAMCLEKRIDAPLDRIVKADSGTLVTAYQKRLKKLETEKLILTEKLANQEPNQSTFDHLFEHACVFLANPWKISESGNLALLRTVLKLAFADRIAYSRNEAVRARKTSIVFSVLEGVLPKIAKWRTSRERVRTLCLMNWSVGKSVSDRMLMSFVRYRNRLHQSSEGRDHEWGAS